MAALSTTQTNLLSRISKPSVERSVKHDSAPGRPKTYDWISTKRKRDIDDLRESSGVVPALPVCKKPKLFFAQSGHPVFAFETNQVSRPSLQSTPINKARSPPATSTLSLVCHNLSQPIRTLITLHKYFLQALSLHYAHSRGHAPAELGRLLETVTRLWKERSVTKEDIQRMLALYEVKVEIALPDGMDLIQSLSPFKLVTAGSCNSIEFFVQRKKTGEPISSSFVEKDLQESYRSHIYRLESAWIKHQHEHLSFFDEDASLDDFPRLAFSIGTQTAARKAQASKQRGEILKLSSAAQIRNEKASTSRRDPITELISREITSTERKKQDLLDRIKAKELALKARAKPTAEQILRKHALDRIPEVVDVLRMMQQQQQKGESKSRVYDNNSNAFKSANRSGKVSFNRTQIRDNIKSSTSVPISDEEVMMCLKMLSDELDGSWVQMVETGSTSKTVFVVIEGEGMSGKEVQRRLTAQMV
ncbi:hypothetical protein EPUS_07030 [Endocarpon pusillum Z07020]|uniref:DNA replication factor Cdt1 C-terminal domain-containing protein n=1 Tax=Endocarpon pusillum (strain Z07020 / HMAS-L-300199) TaxID=1263415 RepID=U1HLB1_ENDPU|nr:uncharacterized protein EPUS_07030 [Endocarpon pusillum Z07020]ERF69774.1 hypothetical protein EPUS_07030 [Endocarpon pusillum Z07020]